MKTGSITPGYILKARALSPQFLERQWSAEIVHASANLNLRELAFSEADWDSWDWNAREALHLNGKDSRLLWHFRSLSDLQLNINFHLLHSYRHLVSGWRQWDRLAHVSAVAVATIESSMSFLMVSAQGRIEQAEVKQSSMENQKNKVLQALSLRQLRFYQQLSALLTDLIPVVNGTDPFIGEAGDPSNQLESMKKDIFWHAKELERQLGSLESRPNLMQRIRLPRREINRLLGVVSQYHARFLRNLLDLRGS